jgi:hypothetical protein
LIPENMRVDHLISDFTRKGVLLILSPLYNWQLPSYRFYSFCILQNSFGFNLYRDWVLLIWFQSSKCPLKIRATARKWHPLLILWIRDWLSNIWPWSKSGLYYFLWMDFNLEMPILMLMFQMMFNVYLGMERNIMWKLLMKLQWSCGKNITTCMNHSNFQPRMISFHVTFLYMLETQVIKKIQLL